MRKQKEFRTLYAAVNIHLHVWAAVRKELVWTELFLDGRSLALDGRSIALDGRRWILDGRRLDLDGTSLDGTFLDGACSSKGMPARYNVKWCWPAPSLQRTLRPNRLRPSRRSVRPKDAPSKSAPSKSTLRPSNGRSVQIGSVQAVDPSVQVDAPSVQGGAPSVQTIFFAPKNSAPSVHRPWTDGALVWTERFRARESGSVRPSSKALRPSRGSVRPSRRSVRPT
eukprot:gene17490-biopygen844